MNELEALQLQRSMFAYHAAMAEKERRARQFYQAVDALDLASRIIQSCMSFPGDPTQAYIRENIAILEKLNAALIAMPQPAYEAADGGL